MFGGKVDGVMKELPETLSDVKPVPAEDLLHVGAVALVLYRRLSPFPLRALVVPELGDADLLRALAQPLRSR